MQIRQQQGPNPRFVSLVGPIYAMSAAFLFGTGAPFRKLLLDRQVDSLVLACLFSVGAAVGLAIIYLLRYWLTREPQSLHRVKSYDWGWLISGSLVGALISPILLVVGIASSSASTASLLLNLEGVLTAAIAWILFKEAFSWRIVWGMVAIISGSALLAWSTYREFGLTWGTIAIMGACFGWALDNNLMRKVSMRDSIQVSMLKSGLAGVLSLLILLPLQSSFPSMAIASVAGALGFITQGISLIFFVLALRYIGSSRTGAYFSLAPFIGAALSILLLNEPAPPFLFVTTGLMAIGVWLCITEQVHRDTEI